MTSNILTEKLMKKIIQIIMLVLLLPLVGLSQNKAIEKLFDKYESVKGFELENGDSDINFEIDNDNDFAGFLNDMNNFSVLSFEKGTGKKDDLNNFKVKLDKIINKDDFQSMLDIQSDGDFRLLTRKDKNGNTSDYLMIIEDEDDASFILASAKR